MAKSKTLELSIKIAGKMDKSLTAALTGTQNQISSFATSISKIGTAGLAAMGALATGAVKVMADCTTEAAKNENYMSDVVKHVDNLADATGKVSNQMASNGKTFAENYAVMEESLKDLSTQIPYTFEDLTRLASAAGQSGKTFSELTQTTFLKDIAMWGTAMDVSADQAGDWGAKWEQAFKMNHEQVMEVADVINYLGNSYATTAAEIAESVNASASMGQLAGVDVKATAAIAASMQAMGVSSDRVGTSIKRIYTNITKGSAATSAQEAAFARLGFTATGIAEAMQADGAGTLLQVFEAVNNLPDAEKLSVLNSLFGQWAVEGGAKITQNLDLLTGMLKEVDTPDVWKGSMEKEFIIKATTPEAIETMLGNTRSALMDDIGTAFLPAKKEFNLAMIDFLNEIRDNMQEPTRLAETLGTLASKGVSKLGDAMDWALPYIQKGLDYLVNNGDQVAGILVKVAAAFAAMKFAPAAEGLLSGAGSLLLGSSGGGGKNSGKTGGLLGGIKSLFQGGQKAANSVGTVFDSAKQAAGMMAGGKASPLSGGIAGAWAAIQNIGALNSTNVNRRSAAYGRMNNTVQSVYHNGLFGAVKNAIGGTGAGQYIGGIGSSLGSLGKTLGNTKTGGLVKSLGSSIGGALNAATLGLRTKVAGVGAAGIIQGSILKQNAGNLFGKASGFVGSIANSGAGKAIGGALGSIGSVAKSGAGLLSSMWGPITSGFGSLLSGALPIVGVISGIIAVVSILGDNLEGIRNIIGSVFGEQGVAVFDSFTGALGKVGEFFNGLFAEGGVASALAPLREGIANIFGPDAAAAFDGVTTILQSVMGVIGQLVNFAVTTVKPIILDVFNFITQTVVPIILQTFSAAAPAIGGIISGIGSAVMTVAEIIGQAIQFAWPVIEAIARALLNVGQVVIPAVLEYFSVFADGLSSAIEGVKAIFEGVITFITGVFSGNWSQAWEGVKSIFTGIFDTLGALFKTPINAVISLINKAISGINGLGLKIPDWVPIIGGKNFSINIPQIPMLAKGGFTSGPSIAGEAGTEAVISFQRSVRRDNLKTWAKAGELLGVKPVELKDPGEAPGGGQGSFTFAPNIVIQGNADRTVIDQALAEAKAQFEGWYLQMQRRQARTSY